MSPAAMPQKRHSVTSLILTCAPRGLPPTYMVAVLRTLGAPPRWRTTRPLALLAARKPGALPAAIAAWLTLRDGLGGGGIVEAGRRTETWRKDSA